MKAHSSTLSRRYMVMAAAAFLVGIMIAALGITLVAEQAWAGGQPYGTSHIENMKSTSSMATYKKSSHDRFRTLSSLKSPSKKISSAKSSNKKVATVKVNCGEYSGERYYSLAITLKGKGTTNITFKWGSKKYKVKYTVKKYANPLKSFKVGKNQFASGFAPSKQIFATPGVNANGKSLSGKLQVKLKKGWKLKKAWYWTGTKYHPVKNGGKVKKAQDVWIYVKKGSLEECLYVYA